MDAEIKADLARLVKETDLFTDASKKRSEWSAKENRHHTRMKALLDLVVARAVEIGETLPEDVIASASSAGISVHALQRVKQPAEESAVKPVEDALLKTPDALRKGWLRNPA